MVEKQRVQASGPSVVTVRLTGSTLIRFRRGSGDGMVGTFEGEDVYRSSRRGGDAEEKRSAVEPFQTSKAGRKSD